MFEWTVLKVKNLLKQGGVISCSSWGVVVVLEALGFRMLTMFGPLLHVILPLSLPSFSVNSLLSWNTDKNINFLYYTVVVSFLVSQAFMFATFTWTVSAWSKISELTNGMLHIHCVGSGIEVEWKVWHRRSWVMSPCMSRHQSHVQCHMFYHKHTLNIKVGHR